MGKIPKYQGQAAPSAAWSFFVAWGLGFGSFPPPREATIVSRRIIRLAKDGRFWVESVETEVTEMSLSQSIEPPSVAFSRSVGASERRSVGASERRSVGASERPSNAGRFGGESEAIFARQGESAEPLEMKLRALERNFVRRAMNLPRLERHLLKRGIGLQRRKINLPERRGHLQRREIDLQAPKIHLPESGIRRPERGNDLPRQEKNLQTSVIPLAARGHSENRSVDRLPAYRCRGGRLS